MVRMKWALLDQAWVGKPKENVIKVVKSWFVIYLYIEELYTLSIYNVFYGIILLKTEVTI